VSLETGDVLAVMRVAPVLVGTAGAGRNWGHGPVTTVNHDAVLTLALPTLFTHIIGNPLEKILPADLILESV